MPSCSTTCRETGPIVFANSQVSGVSSCRETDPFVLSNSHGCGGFSTSTCRETDPIANSPIWYTFNGHSSSTCHFLGPTFDQATTNHYYKLAQQDILWKRIGNRYAAWYTTTNCRCTYKYAGINWTPNTYPEWLTQLTDLVIEKCNFQHKIYPNCVNANMYTTGEQKIGWHSDNEQLFHTHHGNTIIISLSLGAARQFQWKRKGDTDEDAHTYTLQDGEIMIMAGDMQKFYSHSVCPSQVPTPGRINFTWRFIDDSAHNCRLRRRGCSSFVLEDNLPCQVDY